MNKEVNPIVSFDRCSWEIVDQPEIYIINGKEVTIEYPRVDGYFLPESTTLYTDGTTKDLKITYTLNANGYDYVDLGLSVLWATCNIGASSPEEYGDYYTWGGSTNMSTSDDYSGETDLPISRDTARIKMGGSWRMPTKAEFEELINNCNRSWTKQNNVQGYLLTSKKNSQTIFFPAAGWWYYGSINETGSFGNYWSRDWNSVDYAKFLRFDSSQFYVHTSGFISNGYSVRGVL